MVIGTAKQVLIMFWGVNYFFLSTFQHFSIIFNIFSPTMYKVYEELKNIILSVFFVHNSLSFYLNMYWKPIGYICHDKSVFFNTFLYFCSDWPHAVIDAAKNLFKKNHYFFNNKHLLLKYEIFKIFNRTNPFISYFKTINNLNL